LEKTQFDIANEFQQSAPLERRFPLDTDLLADVSTAKSSMRALTKGAIENKIIEGVPTTTHVSQQ